MNLKMADRLVELRKKNGFSQEELADKLNVSRQAVSKWERAECAPDTDNLIALSKLYNKSIDEMLNGENASLNRVNDSGVIVLPFSKKTALKASSIVFLSLGILFIMLGVGLFLGFTIPETIDLKIAQNENITPTNAQVNYKIETNVYYNLENKYRISFSWFEKGEEKTDVSNAIYSKMEAEQLVGKTIQIRVYKGHGVMVNYQRSVLSLLGNIFILVFGGLGILFIIAFIFAYIFYKKERQKAEFRI